MLTLAFGIFTSTRTSCS